ncbi:MAG: transcriptional regulator GcvA [Rhodospirillales bacterium]|nr:transcriptional regulator GcvA [Rhodospirillales bacterium]
MARKIPPLNSLKAFEAAARLLSFTKAAEELHVTQAAVSHQVKGLEDYFGFPLFERRTRALALTEAGKRYLPDLSLALDSMEKATRRLLPGDSDDSVLTISVSPTFLSRWLIPRIVRWQEKHPDIELRLSSTSVVVDFETESFDAAIRYGLGGWPNLYSERLFEERVFPVCAPSVMESLHPLRQPCDIKFHTLIHDTAASDRWRLWLTAAGVEGIDASAGLQFNTVNDAFNAAIEGLGIALGRNPFATKELDEGSLVAPFGLTLPMNHAFHLVYPTSYASFRKVRAFREWLVEEVAMDES